ncbi:MAG: multiheme c-type cytochrome [Pirellulaceae bacterium]|nr:multiheme c-type cytochrome [Pirellulaceae bacterium]
MFKTNPSENTIHWSQYQSVVFACVISCCAIAIAQEQSGSPELRKWTREDGQQFLPLSCPAQPMLQPNTQPNLQPVNPFQLQSNQLPQFQNEQARLRAFLTSGGQDLLAPSGNVGGDSDLLNMGPSKSDTSALEGMGPATNAGNLPGANHGIDKPLRDGLKPGEDPHAEAFAADCYPSAITCAKCHQKIYDEWRVSSHAYATISPMFQKFEQRINALASGTIGTFCVRCHAPVATQMNFPRYGSYADAPPIIREGITCVACHRVKEMYGRTNGERRIEPGDATQPVYGSFDGSGVARAIADKDNLKIKLDPKDKKPGQVIHQAAIQFEQISHSSFCTSCHQVSVYPGIALEVVWAQYRASPACKKGVSCQDCHMGLVPGKALGYSYGAAAEVNGKTVDNNRKHSSHLFYGPGQSIAHPGLFPHNEKSLRWNLDQWLEFDWRAGWGTPEFEKAVSSKQIQVSFPEAWKTIDERKDARKVLDENAKLLAIKRASSEAVMSAAAHVDGPFFDEPPRAGQPLPFHYVVHNHSDGHNLPTGSLGAQPQLWLNVVLTGPDGRWRWESGQLDCNGDLCDLNSEMVTSGRIKADHQLFNLQTKFLITGVKGTDRELCLPINIDTDQLPFIRPGAQPITVLNHPPTIRMEAHSIPPLGSRKAKYRVPPELLQQPGTYRLSVRMRSRMEPLYFMRFCDATLEMQRRMLEQTLDIAQHSIEFEVR